MFVHRKKASCAIIQDKTITIKKNDDDDDSEKNTFKMILLDQL